MWKQNFLLAFGLLANANFYAFLTLVQLKKCFRSAPHWLVLDSSFQGIFLKNNPSIPLLQEKRVDY